MQFRLLLYCPVSELSLDIFDLFSLTSKVQTFGHDQIFGLSLRVSLRLHSSGGSTNKITGQESQDNKTA